MVIPDTLFFEFITNLEAREEYISRYLEGNVGKATWTSAASSRPLLAEVSLPDEGPLAPEQINKLPPLDITAEECVQLGYMPLRDDYEKVCDFLLTDTV